MIGVTVDKPWSTSPDLKGHAAEIRHFVPALALVLRRRRITSVEMAHMSAAVENLARFYVELDSEGMFMRPAAAERGFQRMKKCLQHYVWLHTLHEDTLRFPLRPKLHWCYHIAQNCRFQNPRFQWTYKNEDWVGRVACIGSSCAHGTRATKVAGSMMSKYSIMLHNRLLNALVGD